MTISAALVEVCALVSAILLSSALRSHSQSFNCKFTVFAWHGHIAFCAVLQAVDMVTYLVRWVAPSPLPFPVIRLYVYTGLRPTAPDMHARWVCKHLEQCKYNSTKTTILDTRSVFMAMRFLQPLQQLQMKPPASRQNFFIARQHALACRTRYCFIELAVVNFSELLLETDEQKFRFGRV